MNEWKKNKETKQERKEGEKRKRERKKTLQNRPAERIIK
jgi:hypothetical protein